MDLHLRPGCHGIIEGRAGDGCCSHGAFFTDEDDEKRVRAAAQPLTRETWQHYRRGFKNYTEMDTVDGSTPARRTATRPDGPCVFLNDPDFPGGGGCALHGQALRDGRHPLEYKPDVCWQLPVRRDQEWTKRPDGSKSCSPFWPSSTAAGWGEGGHDLHWRCTSSPEAHVGSEAMYRSYGPELIALIGERRTTSCWKHWLGPGEVRASWRSTRPPPPPRAGRQPDRVATTLALTIIVHSGLSK